jgi:hypothetical protein
VPPARSPEQIRASIEDNRRELGRSLERLRDEVAEAKDWRKQITQRKQPLLIGAAAVGFLLGGGIAGITGLFRRG